MFISVPYRLLWYRFARWAASIRSEVQGYTVKLLSICSCGTLEYSGGAVAGGWPGFRGDGEQRHGIYGAILSAPD